MQSLRPWKWISSLLNHKLDVKYFPHNDVNIKSTLFLIAQSVSWFQFTPCDAFLFHLSLADCYSLSVQPVCLCLTECPTFQHKKHWCWSACWVTVPVAVATGDNQPPPPRVVEGMSWKQRQEATAGAWSLLAQQPLSWALSAVGHLSLQMSTVLSQWRHDCVELTLSLCVFPFLSSHISALSFPLLYSAL